GSVPSNSDVCAGSDASAENVSGPMNRCASSVRTGATWTPASTRRRHTSTALYAAIPPQTPSTTRGIGRRGSLGPAPGQADASGGESTISTGASSSAPASVSSTRSYTILLAEISSSAIDRGLRETDVTWGGTIRPRPSPSWL